MADNQNARSGERFNLKDFFFTVLSKWYWLALSVVLCLGAAIFYIARTPKIYTRYAVVLIKETAIRRGTSELETMLTMGGMSQQNSKLPNEIIAIQSPDLMKEVVQRLGLDYDYSVSGRTRRYVLYGSNLPVKARLLEAEGAASFDVAPVSDNAFKVSMERPGSRELLSYAGCFGDTLSTAFGPLVIDRNPNAGVPFDQTIHVTHTSVHAATVSYNARLNASALDMKNYSDVLKLTITDQSPRRAEDVLNNVINVYNENWVDDRNKMAVSTSRFINDRLVAIEKELGDVDTDISSFKSRYVIPSVSAATDLYMSQSAEASRQLENLENQLYAARYVLNSLSSSQTAGQMIPAPPSLSNSNITSQIAKYNDLLLERNNIVSNSSERNPLVVEADANLSAMRNVILTSIDDLINTLQAQMDNLRRSEQRATSRLADNPNQEKYLQSVTRQQKVKESLYLFLLQKREENELTQAFTAYNTRIITHPTGSSSPSSPNTKRIILIALILGLMLPVGVIYLVESMDTKVRGRRDLESLPMPFIGEIPLSGGKKKFGKAPDAGTSILVRHNKRDAVNEAFRVCRTNLEFICKGAGGKVAAVTSFNPGSGKTFISANLGAAMAIGGSKVLIIDGDLRRASLSSYVGTPKKGLSDYVINPSLSMEDVMVQPEGYSSLWVIPVGTVPPNPSELIGSERFAALIEEARGKFDYIFIDCPPYNVVADARIVSDKADRTVFIVRSGMLELSMLSELEQLENQGVLKGMSVLLNGTPMVSGRYGYHYGYGYHTYGYYSSKES